MMRYDDRENEFFFFLNLNFSKYAGSPNTGRITTQINLDIIIIVRHTSNAVGIVALQQATLLTNKLF